MSHEAGNPPVTHCWAATAPEPPRQGRFTALGWQAHSKPRGLLKANGEVSHSDCFKQDR